MTQVNLSYKDDLLNLISILDTAIASNRRRSVEPIIILLEHYIKQHHADNTSIKLKIDASGHRLEENEHSIFAQKNTGSNW